MRFDSQPVTPTNPTKLVVVRFHRGTPTRYEKNAEETTELAPLREGWSQLKERFPMATLEPLYQDAEPNRLREVAAPHPNPTGRTLLPVHDPTSFYTVRLEPGQDINELIQSIKAFPDVADVYPLRGPAPPPEFDPSNDTLAVRQGYLNPAPEGIDIFSAQAFPGGDGQGVRFIDIEQGWLFEHEDLIDAQIRLLWGVNVCLKGHGTAVLGQIAATDNDKGIVGIARGCRVSAVSQWETPDETSYNTGKAILAAVEHLEPGDVLLLEAQIDTDERPGIYFPVEIEEPTREALAIAYNKGIIVIEAAGNGNNRDVGENLDNVPFLNRTSHSFIESGAIIVGAASSDVPHRRLNFSNFGNRIDCYAWGENITTTGDGEDGQDPKEYTDTFAGTSGASPIIAGAAILIQAIHKALKGHHLWPEEMRAILTNPETGTLPENPELDRIGVMPDLRRILETLFSNPA